MAEQFSDSVRRYAALTDEEAAALDEAAGGHEHAAHPQFPVAVARALAFGDAGMLPRFGVTVEPDALAGDRHKAVTAALRRKAAGEKGE